MKAYLKSEILDCLKWLAVWLIILAAGYLFLICL